MRARAPALVLAYAVLGIVAAHGDATGQARAHYHLGLDALRQGQLRGGPRRVRGRLPAPAAAAVPVQRRAGRRAAPATPRARSRSIANSSPPIRYSVERAEAEAHRRALGDAAAAGAGRRAAARRCAAARRRGAGSRGDSAADSDGDGADARATGRGRGGAVDHRRRLARPLGAVLLGIGGARFADAQTSYATFDEAHEATPLVVSGAALLGVGGALVIAGAIRSKRAR